MGRRTAINNATGGLTPFVPATKSDSTCTSVIYDFDCPPPPTPPAQLCQQQRDQLRDRSGRLHPLDFFDIAKTPFHCPVDMFTCVTTALRTTHSVLQSRTVRNHACVGNTGDPHRTYQRYPVMFTKYRAPQSQPLSLGRTLAIPPLPGRSLVGDYNQYSDTWWKGQAKAMFT